MGHGLCLNIEIHLGYSISEHLQTAIPLRLDSLARSLAHSSRSTIIYSRDTHISMIHVYSLAAIVRVLVVDEIPSRFEFFSHLISCICLHT